MGRVRLPVPRRREQIIEVATELLSRDGYYRFSLTELAAACGITRPGVTHHFAGKVQLLLAVLAKRDDDDFRAMRAVLDAGPATLREVLDTQVRRNIAHPELVRLYSLLEAEAMDASHPAHEYFQTRWSDSIGEMTTLLPREDADGARDLAVRVYAFLDGLQVNWLRDPTIDFWSHWDRFASENLDRAIAPVTPA